MSTTNAATPSIFEQATRMKLRFSFRGQQSVEDLWDLDVEDLDAIHMQLSKQAKDASGESLLKKRNEKDQVLDLQMEIIKSIVATKEQEKEDRENAAARRAQKEKLKAILEQKEDAALNDLTPEQIRAMLND